MLNAVHEWRLKIFLSQAMWTLHHRDMCIPSIYGIDLCFKQRYSSKIEDAENGVNVRIRYFLQLLALTFHRRAANVCKKVYFSPGLCLAQDPGMLLMSMAAVTPGCLHRLIFPAMLLGVPAYLTRQHLPI